MQTLARLWNTAPNSTGTTYEYAFLVIALTTEVSRRDIGRDLAARHVT